ncbi:TPA: hypothetical protein N0F65_001336 [Lagenidium giganteum]|uniref:Uncharacterized protein n=1 Tax=Lagenidium giganteum TaxID=4803 RepID=A0AAV2YYQ1_9STRA|nr:TPA: hypothetical protein N0F65_001336 [Lagenidium giganteum]
MAKTKKPVPKNELESEALAEWLSRGLNVAEFTMETMAKIWQEEDGDDDDDDGDEEDTDEALSAKRELMNGFHVLDSYIQHAKETAARIKEMGREEAINALKTAWKYAELPPLRRRRYLREHVVHVHQMDAESHKYFNIKLRFKEQFDEAQALEKEMFFGIRKRNNRRAPLVQRVRELKAKADKETNRRILEEIEQKRRQRAEEELEAKRQAKAEKDKFVEDQRVYRRKMNMKFWKKQLVEAKEYSLAHEEERQRQHQEQFDAQVELMKAEIEEMEGQEDADARVPFDRTVTTSSVGVYGTAFEPGEWNSATDGGDRPGMDDHTISANASHAFIPEHELKRNEHLEAQSKRMMLEEKLEQIEVVKMNLAQDRRTIMGRRDVLLLEIKNIAHEYEDLSTLLAGPPRRDPSEDEKMQFHMLVARRGTFMQQLQDLDCRIVTLQKRLDIAERSGTALAPLLEAAQQREASLQLELDEIDEDRQDLPVVIGRAIQPQQAVPMTEAEIEAIPDITKPAPNLNSLWTQVTMQSKFEIMKTSAEPAQEHYKKAKRLEMESWKMREVKKLDERDLDQTKVRLANLRDRFIEQQHASLRLDLVRAIQRFHQGNQKLRKCIFPLTGTFNWWQYHHVKKSLWVDHELIPRDVIVLTDGQMLGHLRGSFKLPKHCFYRIKFEVHRLRYERKTMAYGDLADDDDIEPGSQEVRLFVGSDFDSLQLMSFVDLGGKDITHGPLTFEFYGARLCFCFEFGYRNGFMPKQLTAKVVLHNVASYEERIHDFRDEEKLELMVQKEKQFLSEMVKMIRVQSSQTSSERCAELLQELIRVEKSKARTWDSKILHGHVQRFQRVLYSKMLKTEIKKEIARQIDVDVSLRRGRIVQVADKHLEAADTSDQELRMEASKYGTIVSHFAALGFQSRKVAFIEPIEHRAMQTLGQYINFKSDEDHATSPESTGHIHRNAMVSGARFEWREAKTKLRITYKLVGPDAESNMVTGWYNLEETNAVFLASACAAALKIKRQSVSKERQLEQRKVEQIQQLQKETAKTIAAENDAREREKNEDVYLQKMKERDVERRAKQFHDDAIRMTTYNEQLSSQMDFQAQRRLNVAQHTGVAISMSDALADVKENFASHFVDGRLALVKKTWERKERRIAEKRDHERREREHRINKERDIIEDITRSNQEELRVMHAENDQISAERLKIPNFHLAVAGEFPCEHLDLKAWGAKYETGLKCKKCGKEMSKSYDDPTQGQGADIQLNEEVQIHRKQAIGGKPLKFRNSKHLETVENERFRLEKEARDLELTEALLYDRRDPKSIDEINFRHGFNRSSLDFSDSDDLFARLVHEAHKASFQDEILFHGRLKNFYYRVDRLNEQYAHTNVLLAVQREFLESVQKENNAVLGKLPRVEADHVRAVALLKEDDDAKAVLEEARKALVAAQRERQAAFHAQAGVDEEAEFAEFHGPALIRCSDEMKQIYERTVAEKDHVVSELKLVTERLKKAEQGRRDTENMMAKLYHYHPGSILRTRFGLVKVLEFRQVDEFVLTRPLQWDGTLYIRSCEIVALEALHREEEQHAMEAEDNNAKKFYVYERQLEREECKMMEMEDTDIRRIVRWWDSKVRNEAIVADAICHDELEIQLDYELTWKKTNRQSAVAETKRLFKFHRATLRRSRRPKALGPPRPSKMTLMRVARACEKRLAMHQIEHALCQKDSSLRGKFEKENDQIAVDELAGAVLDELMHPLLVNLAEETTSQGLYLTKVYREVNSHALVTETSKNQVHGYSYLELERLWVARSRQYQLTVQSWKKEYGKFQALRKEIQRREDEQRRAEEERLMLDRRCKEMHAEERLCRKFYLEETMLFMRERKAMASAELEMREYLRQLDIEAMKAKFSKMVEDKNHVNDKEARRLEIKLGKNEKHRLYREWAQVRVEDELSLQMRERDLAEAEAKALARQFDKYLIQQMLEGRVAADIEASRIADRLREAQRIAMEKKAALEAKLVQDRMMAAAETFYRVADAEREWLEAAERALFWQRQQQPLEDKLAKMKPELDRIMHEREHVVSDAKAKREYARLCHERFDKADLALKEAIKVEEERLREWKRIHFFNSSMDSDVIHDRPQRFSTPYLRDQLQQLYFSMLTELIVRRAIVEANEREAKRLEDKLQQLNQERVTKLADVSRLQRKHRREFHLRLRRAELGKLMFGHSQKVILRDRFQQWVKIWSQRVMVRASFDLKHGLIMHQRHLTEDFTVKATQALNTDGIRTKLSLLHDYHKRRVQCRLCKREYSEEQNNRYACSYHPAAYELACVRSCPSRAGGGAGLGGGGISDSCMLHRAKRWRCCDETEEGRYGRNGCARRFHMPTRSNPAMTALVAKIDAREQSLLAQINEQLQSLKERDVLGKSKQVTKTAVSKIEEDLAAKREIVAKYATLDQRK